MLAVTVTLTRLPLLAALMWSTLVTSSDTWIWLAAIVIIDLFDGVLARVLVCDTDTRRALDAGIDRVTVLAAFGAAAFVHPSLLALYLPLITREALVLGIGGWIVVRLRLLIVGGRWHKLGSLTSGGFGLAIVQGMPVPLAASVGLIAIAVNYVLLADYAGGVLLADDLEDRPGRFRIERLAGLIRLVPAGNRFRGRSASQFEYGPEEPMRALGGVG